QGGAVKAPSRSVLTWMDGMKVDGKSYRTIWLNEDGWSVEIIDQTKFPHRLETVTLRSAADAAHAIKDMLLRGAPLTGATAAYGMALQARIDPSDEALSTAYERLRRTRPTATNPNSPLRAV